MTLTLGFSPCPNDCFMFDAIVHERIDLEGLAFAPVIVPTAGVAIEMAGRFLR